jgi:hypothetical protein
MRRDGKPKADAPRWQAQGRCVATASLRPTRHDGKRKADATAKQATKTTQQAGSSSRWPMRDTYSPSTNMFDTPLLDV